jgi:hypothetical protein
MPRGRFPAIGEPLAQHLGRWLRVVGPALEKIVDVGEGVYIVSMASGGHAVLYWDKRKRK